MDWNISMHSPWDWGISSSFGEESSEISKLVSSMDWANDEAAGFVGNPSMYLFPSDHPNMVCISSPNSLISASIDSSSKETTNMSNFEAPESFNRDPTKREESMCVEDTGTSITQFSSVGAKEPPTDLMLGKRTYFVDTPSRNTKIGGDALLADDSSQITASGKIHKTSQPSAPTNCCQVEGCNADLFAAKDYHRKHKVCESHSKCPKVRVAGHDCRFCQQCSRFHNLSEFDEKKRSCRKRLSVHNARRRKTQPDAILFNSTGLSSSFYVAAGLGRSVPISNGNISQDQRALYLLSNNSGNTQSSPVNWFMPAHHHTNMAQQPMTQQGFSSNNISAMWHHLQHSKEESHAPPLVLYRNNQFQELQLLNSPYHPDHFCCSHANR